jgi:hypothetical protein
VLDKFSFPLFLPYSFPVLHIIKWYVKVSVYCHLSRITYIDNQSKAFYFIYYTAAHIHIKIFSIHTLDTIHKHITCSLICYLSCNLRVCLHNVAMGTQNFISEPSFHCHFISFCNVIYKLWDLIFSVVTLCSLQKNEYWIHLHHLSNCISRSVTFQTTYVEKSVLRFYVNLSSHLVVSHMKGRTLKSIYRYVVWV